MSQSVNTQVTCVWPQPTIIDSIAGKICIANLTNTVRILRRNAHFCQIRKVFLPDVLPTRPAVSDKVCSRAVDVGPGRHSSSIQIDLDGMLSAIVQEYNDVFDPNYRVYNGNIGPFEAAVDIRPVERPQRKEHLPQY